MTQRMVQDGNDDSDEDMETEQTDDTSDTSSVTGSLNGQLRKTVRNPVNVGNSSTSTEKTQNVDSISRCSMGQRSIIEYEEDSRIQITTERSSLASRALITMKRSRSEGAHKLKVYNVQDNFVINRCLLWIGIDGDLDRSSQECTLELIPLEEANKMYNKPSTSKTETNELPLLKNRKKRKHEDKKKKPEDPSVIPELTLTSSKVSEIKQRLSKILPFQVFHLCYQFLYRFQCYPIKSYHL